MSREIKQAVVKLAFLGAVAIGLSLGGSSPLFAQEHNQIDDGKPCSVCDCCANSDCDGFHAYVCGGVGEGCNVHPGESHICDPEGTT